MARLLDVVRAELAAERAGIDLSIDDDSASGHLTGF
jgi:hypothetical protein